MNTNNIIQNILSWLVFHANKSADKNFYPIKNKLLNKYGILVGYDVQFIEGKKCFTCNGTGIYIYYDWWTGKESDRDYCYHCHKGWYKRPVWNILKVIKFGKYTFHSPWQKVYEKPENLPVNIDGYVSHQKTKYTKFALFILFNFYDFRGYWIRYYKSVNGFRIYWWHPRNWVRNLIYFWKYKLNGLKLPNDLPF